MITRICSDGSVITGNMTDDNVVRAKRLYEHNLKQLLERHLVETGFIIKKEKLRKQMKDAYGYVIV